MTGGPLRTGFPTFVNNELPVAVPGDFASVNPHVSILGGPGEYVAPAAGTLVGAFAWFNPTTNIASNYLTVGAFIGFVHRENNALITQFLGISTQQIVPGNAVNGLAQGEVFGIFAAGGTIGQKVYADPVTGALTAAATGATSVGTNAAGASVTSGVLTTTDADQTGLALAVNQLVIGGTLPDGTYIASSAGTGSGTHLWNLANVNGTVIADIGATATVKNYGPQETIYTLGENVQADVTSTASSIAATGVLTTGGAVTGNAIAQGDFVSGTGVPNNVQILYQISGTAGAGSGATYQTNAVTVVGAATFTFSTGKTAKITSWGG